MYTAKSAVYFEWQKQIRKFGDCSGRKKDEMLTVFDRKMGYGPLIGLSLSHKTRSYQKGGDIGHGGEKREFRVF